MLTLETDSFSWSADASGYNLTLRSPRAKQICDAVKPKKKYTVEIKEYRKKRSLDQNALYWKCVHALAAEIECSVPMTHNVMLRRYGAPEIIDDKPVYVMLPDTEQATEKANEAETYHLKPTSHTREKNGAVTRAWMLLRGSHDLDTKEMKRLIDGVLEECRNCGIDVMTDQERALWQQMNTENR